MIQDQVKPGKVICRDSIVGLSFCGFTVNENLEPVPTSPEKLMASLLKPYKVLPDLESLHGKLLPSKCDGVALL